MKFSCSKFSFASMKTIFILIFLGYLGCTFAFYDNLPEDCMDLEDEAQFPLNEQSISNGSSLRNASCKLIQDIVLFHGTDFTLQFFFRDWYVTHLKNQGSPPECSKFETSIIGDIKLNYRSRGQDVECSAHKNSLKKYFRFDCKGSRSSFTKFFIVLETDSYYADYALVYVCNESGSTSDNFLVLQRTKSNSVPSGIISALSDVGMRQSDLKSNNCA